MKDNGVKAIETLMERKVSRWAFRLTNYRRVIELLKPMGEWLEERSNQSQNELMSCSSQWENGWKKVPTNHRTSFCMTRASTVGEWLDGRYNQSQNEFLNCASQCPGQWLEESSNQSQNKFWIVQANGRMDRRVFHPTNHRRVIALLKPMGEWLEGRYNQS